MSLFPCRIHLCGVYLYLINCPFSSKMFGIHKYYDFQSLITLQYKDSEKPTKCHEMTLKLCGLLQKWYLKAQPSCNILSTARLDRICTSTTTRSLENRKLLAPELASGSRTKIVQKQWELIVLHAINFKAGVLRKDSFIN